MVLSAKGEEEVAGEFTGCLGVFRYMVGLVCVCVGDVWWEECVVRVVNDGSMLTESGN